MATNVLHISISDAKGGAAIAAFRLNKLMNQCLDINSKMLVMIKTTSDTTITELNWVYKLIARVNRYSDRLINLFKQSEFPFSNGLIRCNIHSNVLLKDADVIYIHWINSGMLSWESIDKIINLKKPVVFVAHDMWFFSGGCHQAHDACDYIHKSNSYVIYGLNSFKIKCLKNYTIKLFFNKRKSYLQSNVKLIAPSREFYNKLISSNIIDKSKTGLIPNIIDSTKFVPIKKTADKQIKVLYGAMGGKSNIFKGWSDFVYFGERINKIYGSNISFELFGYDFDDNELMNIPFKVKSHGIIVDDSRLISVYQNADVFIFPSLLESFGQTLYEAMSCGLIPISYNVGFADDIIKNKINGFIVNLGDKDALVSSFNELMTMDIMLLKSNSRRSVENHFSAVSILEKHINLMDQLC
jgi:glycosyltransferase involved in cell wall biosynthesis